MPGIALRRWNLLELFIVPLAASLMRVAWVYLLLRLLTDSNISGMAGVRVPLWLLLFLSFGGAMVSHLDLATREGRLIAVAGGFLACLFALIVVFPHIGLGSLLRQMLYWNNTLPAPFVMLVAAALLWWRGMATEHMNHGALVRAFLTGAGMMTGLLILGRLIPSLLPTGQLVAALITFIVSGLMTLALAGVSGALRQSGEETGIAVQLSRHWLLAVLLVIGGVLLGGWLASSLIAPDTIRHLLGLLRPIWEILGKILYYILLPFVYLLFLLLEPLLRWLSSLYNRRPQETGPQATPTPEETLEQVQRAARSIPPALDFILRVLLAAGLVILLASIFLLALRRRRPSRSNGIVEVRESVWSWDLMRSQLASLLRRRRPGEETPLFLPLTGDAVDPRLAIRAAYQALLALAIEKGYPRSYAQTPYTYQGTLRALCPDEGTAVQTLTDAYVIARYSAQPPTSAQASAAWQAVERIRAALSPRPASATS